jgi:hypothetical protein
MHHPHLLCVVPGGGLSADGERWIGCRPGFFLPVKVLSRFFRRCFLALLERAFEAGELRCCRISLNVRLRLAQHPLRNPLIVKVVTESRAGYIMRCNPKARPSSRICGKISS